MIRPTTICLVVCILMISGFDPAPADAVAPEGTVDVYVIARQSATPVGETVTETLPDSMIGASVGASYVVEIWMQDTWDDSMPGGPSPGLTGGEFDLHYDTSLSDAITLHYEGPFDLDFTHTGDIFEGSGLVDDFSAGTSSAGVGVTPNYARLGYITFDASSVGIQNFALDDEKVARYGLGYVDPSEINLGSASVAHLPLEPLTFTIDHSSMVVGGMINGAILEPEPAPAGMAAGLTGTLEVIVDDLDNPTVIQIQSGSMDVATNIGDGPFRPGIGGEDSTAYGDFAFQAEVSPTELIELAIRNFVLDFSSELLAVSGNERFSAEQIQMEVTGGTLDIRSPSMGGHGYDMTNLLALPVEEEMGTLLEVEPGVYELAFVYERTIDISGLDGSIAAGSYLTLLGTIFAETEWIPEPSTFTMLCLGAIGFFARASRKRCRR